MTAMASESSREETNWGGLIPDGDWQLYRRVLDRALEQDIPFALGGGFAFSYYSRRWRDTKDIDLYVLPRDRERVIRILDQTGFADLFDQKPYDRRWIYRGVQDGVITDVIWAMANQRSDVDEIWLRRATPVMLRGLAVKLLPPEELIWAKLYVVQRERCDWPDLLNVLNVRGANLDWNHLLGRVGGDARVLGGLLSLFSWMCPARAAEFPPWIWGEVGLQPPSGNLDCQVDRENVAFLDSRDWFGPKEPEEQESRPSKASQASCRRSASGS